MVFPKDRKGFSWWGKNRPFNSRYVLCRSIYTQWDWSRQVKRTHDVHRLWSRCMVSGNEKEEANAIRLFANPVTKEQSCCGMQIRTSLDILLLFKFFEVFGGETDRLASRESKVGGSWYEFSISTLDHTSRARTYRGARRDSWATVLGATGAARACRAVLEWETWMSTRSLAL